MSRFFNAALAGLVPYVPGEQPKNVRRLIKLNTNENPYPPAPAVLDALTREETARLRLYSDPACGDFLRALAAALGVGEGQVFASNGSDEALAFAFLAFGAAGTAFPDLTYGFYPVFARLFGLSAAVVPLRPDFTVAVEDYAGLPGTVFLANPNAPTGLALPRTALRRLLEQDRERLVVVDEAYVDFGGESAVPLLREYDNLLVIGTFSKSRCLAGARLGYAAGPEELIADLNRVKFSFNPYNVNRLTLLAGTAALSEPDYYRRCAERIVAERGRAAEALRALGFSVTDSRANFLFAGCPAGLSGREYYEKLRERGILVRRWELPRIENHVRITVGTGEQMDALLAATKDILGGQKP